MITKNYARFLNGASQNGDSMQFVDRLRDINGEFHNVSTNSSSSAGYIASTYTNGLFHNASLRSLLETDETTGTGMFFGSGTTPATSDDYKLENLIEFASDALTVVSAIVSKFPDENTLLVFTFTVKNNSNEPIVISETGLISNPNLRNIYKKRDIFLWARDTFEPVTLQPGETRAFTMTIGLE